LMLDPLEFSPLVDQTCNLVLQSLTKHPCSFSSIDLDYTEFAFKTNISSQKN